MDARKAVERNYCARQGLLCAWLLGCRPRRTSTSNICSLSGHRGDAYFNCVAPPVRTP